MHRGALSYVPQIISYRAHVAGIPAT